MREYARTDVSEEDFQASIDNQCFTIDYGLGEVELFENGASTPVTRQNLEQYIKLASLAALRKAKRQMEHFLSGVHYVTSK